VGLVTCGITNVLGFSAEDYKDFEDQGIVFSPGKAYYPTVIHDGANYLMLYDKNANYATSTDGIAWTYGGTVNGLTNPMHMIMLYDANGFGGGDNYKIWYLDSKAEIPNGANSIRYAESTNGISWTNDQAVFGGNMVTPGDDNVPAPSKTWGPGTVLYNPDATNTGDNPMDYSYVMYYDGYHGNNVNSGTPINEALWLAYSSDGINWYKYTSPYSDTYTPDTVTGAVLRGTYNTWDAEGSPECSPDVGYPTVWQLDDGTYIMWYGGGLGTNQGIGFATSPDGITWTKDSDNPMFHVDDATDPAGYRTSRTYTPRVIDDGSNVLKMYYSAKSGSGTYAVGLATMSKPVTEAEAGKSKRRIIQLKLVIMTMTVTLI
jgi:hypothetical protein